MLSGALQKKLRFRRSGSGRVAVGTIGILTTSMAIGTLSTVGSPPAAAWNPDLTFACNAGNAGGVPDWPSEAVPFEKALDLIVTRYNGPVVQELHTLVVRIRDGRVVAHATSDPQRFRPEQTVPTSKVGWPSSRRLYPDPRTPVAKSDLAFIERHVNALRFTRAVETGDATSALRMLGMSSSKNGNVVIIATIPVPEVLAEGQFTMHPAIIRIAGEALNE